MNHKIYHLLIFTIGWYCRYTADNYNNKFNPEAPFDIFVEQSSGSSFKKDCVQPEATPKNFCGSMCCFRKAYNLKGWFWLNMQFALRFLQKKQNLEEMDIIHVKNLIGLFLENFVLLVHPHHVQLNLEKLENN